MVEIHFHCLPAMDDGPESFDEAAALCRAAAAQGVRTIVATPHALRDPWPDRTREERLASIERLTAMLPEGPAILPGCEITFRYDLVEQWEAPGQRFLESLAGSRYVLIEFVGPVERPHVERVFHELAVLSLVPVIAHPERHPLFGEDVAFVRRLVDLGARVQVTASALLPGAPRLPAAAARELLREGLVHFVASDAHSMGRRPPALAPAREVVRREWGQEIEAALFVENPRALLDDRVLEWA